MTSHATIEMDEVDPLVYRRTVGTFATGVAVVTALHEGEYHGMTMNSLTSVSLDPCMLLVCPRHGSATGKAIADSGEFVINLLGADQEDFSARFVGQFEDRFTGVDVEHTPTGTPLIAEALAHIGCNVVDIHRAGDHDIVVGRVRFCKERSGEPLVFFKGQYGSFVARGD